MSREGSEVLDVVIFIWGAPSRLLSDQGREFVAKVNDKMCEEFGIKRSVTSAYHPQMNGLDERTNQTLKQRLSKLVNKYQNNWCDFLDEVAYSIRTQKKFSTKYILFYLMFGQNPNSPEKVSSTVISSGACEQADEYECSESLSPPRLLLCPPTQK